MKRRVRSFIRVIGSSRIATAGAVLATTGFIADVILIVGELFTFESHPYIGIVSYLMLPGVMMTGLLMIPIGIFLKLRRQGEGFTAEAMNHLVESGRVGTVRRVLQMLLFLSFINLVFFSLVGYRGFHYTESREFCGALCHEVMEPEFTTYSHSPHSEVLCVECHIGPGAGWFVKSKLSGARQVLAVMFDTHPRPIPTPIHNLRPARDVCEICHRPSIFTGNRIKVVENFEPDEQNTPVYTVLNLRVGHGGDETRRHHDIHWHISDRNRIRYHATDHRRENVVWVELDSEEEGRRVWTRPGSGFEHDTVPDGAMREMDCVDCHNRPTHIYLPPQVALDELLAKGSVDPSIPWIRRLGEEILTQPYETKEGAREGIAKLASIYEERYPEHWEAHRAEIERAIVALQEVHALYVYPEMGIEWNTYPSLIGHPTSETARCFRCHGILRDAAGTLVSLDCNTCHFVLANRERDPSILKVLEGQ